MLMWTGRVAVLAGGLVSIAFGGVDAAAQIPALPDAELVTVTDTGFTATWTTAAESDTTVCVGTAPCVVQEQSTRWHFAEVGGLQPGTGYDYTLKSGGVPQLPSATNPGRFATLLPPPGVHLFDFAIVSDTHLGESCSGTAVTVPVGSLPPCFTQPDVTQPGDPPYAAAMAQAAVGELNARGVDLAIFNADNTSHAELDQTTQARDQFNALSTSWDVARGAHDRAGQNAAETRCGADKDCFRSVFFPGRAAGRVFYSFDQASYHFIALDSVGADGSGDLTDAAQNAFLRSDLDRAKSQGRKTFIYFHHPVTEYANTTAFPPVVFGVRADRGGADFLSLMADYPNVVGVLTAHTHRNYVSYSPETGVQLPYIENGATKEYPGGYSVVKVYSGGYTRNFHRLKCEFCRRWEATTRNQYFGLYPTYTLGTLSARNFTHVYDCALPTPPPSPPGGNESAVGGDTFRALCPPGGSADPGAPAPSPGATAPGAGAQTGAGSAQPPGSARDTIPPRLRRLTVRPAAIRSRAGQARRGRRTRLGATIGYRLSEPAKVDFRVERLAAGTRRYSPLGRSFGAKGRSGANRLRFSARLGGGPLAAGRYRVVAVATDAAGNASRAAHKRFRVVP